MNARRIAVPITVAIVSFGLGWFLKPKPDWYETMREGITFRVMPEWMPPQSEIDAEMEKRWRMYRLKRHMRKHRDDLVQHPCVASCTPENCHRKLREQDRKEFLERHPELQKRDGK